MKSNILLVVGAIALSASVSASDLDLNISSGGSNTITVSPGDVVNYSVSGELTDVASQGLALCVFDLSFDGGDLSAADVPTTMPMEHFATPKGLNNPAGYGGTLADGNLVQVGGAQNTINNAFAAEPIGTVLVGVALPGAAETLVTSSLTAPLDPGTYTLSADDVLANVIRAGETGIPFWAVDAAGIGTVTDLTVEVVALTADVPSVSIAGLGSQTLSLDAGAANAGRQYFLIGTFTDTVPGFDLAGGLHVPLNFDVYTQLTIDLPNIIIANSFGLLNGSGEATAVFSVLPGTPAAAAGITLHHAFLLLSPKDYVSNAVPMTFVP